MTNRKPWEGRLWRAVEYVVNIPLAYTFGTREHKNLDELLKLLESFPIGNIYTDSNFAHQKRISAEQLIIGKKNTPKTKRNHLTLRTHIKRLCRKTICFSNNKDFIRQLLEFLSICSSLAGISISQPYYDITSNLSLMILSIEAVYTLFKSAKMDFKSLYPSHKP